MKMAFIFITYSFLSLFALASGPGTIAPITGDTYICYTNSTTLSDSTIGGIWISSDPAIAAVGSATGVVTGTGIGLTTIYYVVGADTARVLFRVGSIPAAPSVSGPAAYCQFIWPFIPDSVSHHSPADTVLWYTIATGGASSVVQPAPNINVAGAYNYWVSVRDSGCEGPRTPVTITVHPKPVPPMIISQTYCWGEIPSPAIAYPVPGYIVRWYGDGVTPGTTVAPTPSTLVAPDTIVYYATETSPWGCVSDSGVDNIIVRALPCDPAAVRHVSSPAEIQVFPNPAKDHIYIEGAGGTTVCIYNLVGKQLLSMVVTDSISISHLPAASYFITLSAKDGHIIHRQQIIKQ